MFAEATPAPTVVAMQLARNAAAIRLVTTTLVEIVDA